MRVFWKKDTFDSEALGISVAKINIGNIQSLNSLPGAIDTVKKEISENRVNYAICKINSKNIQAVQVLERSGFILIDGSIDLEADLSKLAKSNVSQSVEATYDDFEQIKQLTKGLFFLSRIANENLIPVEKKENFYNRWIENFFNKEISGCILILRKGRDLAGYIAIEKSGRISLLGVNPKFQGKGIAKELVSCAMNRFREWKNNKVLVSTQLGNIPALRAYQGSGFKIIESFFTLRWSPND
jgi:dTDP-4-amino-4,6-dideoxy-D-galactose acyltransferase